MKHAAQWIASLEHHVPAEIWHKPIAEIDPPELLAALSSVRALADSESRVPETPLHARQRLDAVFEDAIFHKRCASNPATAIRRKMRETMPPPAGGRLDRFVVFFDGQEIGQRLLYSRALSAINKAPAVGLSLDQIRFTTDPGDVPTNISIAQTSGAWSSVNFARIPRVAWQEEVLVQRLSNSLSERLRPRACHGRGELRSTLVGWCPRAGRLRR